MKVIAIHDGHNAAAALMIDGKIEFAIQEERIIRNKNAGGFPANATDFVLEQYGLTYTDIDQFVFAGQDRGLHPVDEHSAVLKKYDSFFKPYGKLPENQGEPEVKRSLFSKSEPKIDTGSDPVRGKDIQEDGFDDTQQKRRNYLADKGVGDDKICFVEHHLCHAATAAFGWGITEKIAVVTADSYGDFLSGTVSLFENGKLERVATIHHSYSLGRLYSLVTYYLGMVPMEHEFKLMGMAPYAITSKQAREIADYFRSWFELEDDGLRYRTTEGIKPIRDMGLELVDRLRFERFDHICAGLQLFVEEFGLEWIKSIAEKLGVKKLAFAGGFFMNVKLNHKVEELDIVEETYVFPSCGDESNIFGALYFYHHTKTGEMLEPLQHYYWGTEFGDEAVQKAVDSYTFEKCEVTITKEDDIEKKVAELLSKSEIVARYSGRMEFGARALGNRSILANAGSATAVQTINAMIKNRDFWMPFAPSTIDKSRYVHLNSSATSPYMMKTFDTKKEKQELLIGVMQSYDKTCRIHEVLEEVNPEYYKIILEYEKITGEAVILNTSFNLHGSPIVHTPEEAFYVLDHSGLNYLAAGNYLIEKKKHE